MDQYWFKLIGIQTSVIAQKKRYAGKTSCSNKKLNDAWFIFLSSMFIFLNSNSQSKQQNM